MALFDGEMELNVDSGRAGELYEQARAAGMGSLRRGWETGRIGTELNPLYTEALQAKIDEDAEREAAINTRIGQLRQQQEMYAPETSTIEDVQRQGLRSIPGYIASNVGQGVASMADPVAVSAGLNTVGRVAGAFGPAGKAVGALAQGAAMVAPYMMNRQQLMGEHVGSQLRDQALMDSTTPQQRMDNASSYGNWAAVPDSFIPGMVGRQLTGLSRAGGEVARKAAIGPGLRTMGGIGMEGGTEALQSEMSHQYLGQLNPNRDTSGDAMENWNSLAAGAIGGGPFSAAGAYANAGYDRLGAGVDAVQGAVGDTVDLLRPGMQRGADAVTGAVDAFNTNPTIQKGIGKVKDFANAARDSTVDLMSNKDGGVSAKALMENLKTATESSKSKVQAAYDDHVILAGKPPDDILGDDAKIAAWVNESHQPRVDLIDAKLVAMGDDPEAQKHLEAMSSEDDTEYLAAIESAAQFLMSKTPVGRAQGRAAKLSESLGNLAGKAAPIIGRGAVAAGKAAFGFGKGIFDGAQEGMRKKNEQTNEQPDESFQSWRDRTYEVEGTEAAANVWNNQTDPAERVESNQRADLAGSYAADMARRGTAKFGGSDQLAKHAAYSIADMIDTDLSKGSIKDKIVKINRLTDDFADLYGKDSADVITQLGGILGKGATPIVQHMMDRVAAQSSPTWRAEQVSERDALANQVVDLINPTAQGALLKQKINLRTPSGREEVLKTMEDFADKIGSTPEMRKALNETLGEESVTNIINLLNGAQKEKKGDVLIDDRKSISTGSNHEANLDDEELSDYDIAAAEKTATKGSGPKVYGFHQAPNLRTHTERWDMFGAMDKPDPETGQVKRPQLFDDDTTVTIPHSNIEAWNDAAWKAAGKPQDRADWEAKNPGRLAMEDTIIDTKTQRPMLVGRVSALDKKVQDVRTQLMGDSQYANESVEGAGDQHDSHRVTAMPALDVMKSVRMQPGKTLQLYRDYMRMQYNDEDRPEGERKYAQQQAKLAHSAILDSIQKKDAEGELQTYTPKISAGERAQINQDAQEYFKTKKLVVGEQLSNRDPGQITLPEMLDMHSVGKSAIDYSRTKTDPKAALSDSNVLMFRKSGGKGEFAIPAGKLVEWVKQMRGKTEQDSADTNKKGFKNKDKDTEYRNAVAEGIASIVGSGYVSGMPYKINAKGDREPFGITDGSTPLTDKAKQDRENLPPIAFPKSLRLVTQTHGDSMFADEQRREKFESQLPTTSASQRAALQRSVVDAKSTLAQLENAGASKEALEAGRKNLGLAVLAHDEFANANGTEGYGELVAKDQARNAEPFTVEDRAERAAPPAHEGKFATDRRRALSELEQVKYEGMKTEKERNTYVNELKHKYGDEWADLYDLVGPKGAEFAATTAPKIETKNSALEWGGVQPEMKLPLSKYEEQTYRGLKSDSEREMYIKRRKELHGKDWARKYDTISKNIADSVMGGLQVDRSGTIPTEPKFSGDFAGPEWEPKSVPSEFQKNQKPGEVPDEYSSQRWGSQQTGADPGNDDSIGPEPKGTAVSSAQYRARDIADRVRLDVSNGTNEIVTRMRTAMRPAYSDNKLEAVGGAHYIAPIAALIGNEHAAALQEAGFDKEMIRDMRRVTAKVLSGPEVSDKKRVEYVRLFAKDPAAVNKGNVLQLLWDMSERLGPLSGDLSKIISPELPYAEKVNVAKTPLVGKMQVRASEKVRNQVGPLFDDDWQDPTPSFPGSFGRTPSSIPPKLMQGVISDPASKPVSQRFVDTQTAKARERSFAAVDTVTNLQGQAAGGKPAPAEAPKVWGKAAAVEKAALRGPNEPERPGEGFDSPESPLLNGPQDLADRQARYGVKPRGQAASVSTELLAQNDAEVKSLRRRLDQKIAEQEKLGPSFGQVYDERAKKNMSLAGEVGDLRASIRKFEDHSEAVRNGETRSIYQIQADEQSKDVDARLAKIDAMKAKLGQAVPEVANAGLPKGQQTQAGESNAPAIKTSMRDRMRAALDANKKAPVQKPVAPTKTQRVGLVDLEATGPYAAKDQAKSNFANKFIGRGVEGSSTAKYAAKWKGIGRANMGEYESSDTVFVSANGTRADRLTPDFTELGRATAAGAKIITDAWAGRERDYNVGEREVAEFLEKQGYVENLGVWTKQYELTEAEGQRALLGAIVNGFDSKAIESIASRTNMPAEERRKTAALIQEVREITSGAKDTGGIAQKTVTSWANKYIGIGAEVRVVTVAPDSMIATLISSAHGGIDAGGAAIRMDGQSIIMMFPGGSPQRVTSLARLAHEFGHILKWAAFDKASNSVQEQLNAQYENDVKSGSLDNFISPARLFTDADSASYEGVAGKGLGETIKRKSFELSAEGANRNPQFKQYLTSFDEWFAEQFSKYVTSGTRQTLDPELKTFWDKLVSQLKSFFDEVIKLYKPNAKFAEWVDGLADKGGRKLNAQNDRTGGAYEGWKDGPSRVATQADMDQAQAEADKLFGKGGVNLVFKEITGYSGEYIEATNTIEISTTAAAGTMNTLYHEALHKFFKDFVKSNPQMQSVFESLVNDPKHLDKLHALLDGYPAAQAQLVGGGSGEERLAYTYQFWKAGLLQVDAKAHTWLQKIGKFFRHALGMVRDSERALELFQAFDNGKMSNMSDAGKVITKAMNRGTNALKVRRQMDGLLQGLGALTIPAAEILGKSASATARELSTMFFTNPGDASHGTKTIGMMNARRNVAQQYTNVSNRRLENMSDTDRDAVQKHLQTGTRPDAIADKEQREAVADIRNLLDRFHTYLKDSGMDIGKVDDYYPVVWDIDTLVKNRDEFINMLATKYADKMRSGDPKKQAHAIWLSLINKEGVDAHLPVGREDGVLSPFFASQEKRTLPWIEAVDREKYLNKDMPLTMTRYFSQGAHAAEYFRRFGENGEKLDKMLGRIKVELEAASWDKFPMRIEHEISHTEGNKTVHKTTEKYNNVIKERNQWVTRQMRDISQSVGAMEGTLGKDVSPNMRSFNSWMTVYQNVRLLPMALFSSFVDPLALVARGAPMHAAYDTFSYSMREVFRTWADAFKDMPPARAKDEWRQLAEHIGAAEIAMFQHHVAQEYSSTYMTTGAKKINDKMFTFNGMEAWNRGSRIMATKWAVRFIEKHASLPDKDHSARWLKELGLTPAMITMDGDKLVTTPAQLAAIKGITLDEARAQIAPIHDALNRWVEGAVLTPNAAQRPAWSSDPNYATMFHLKQFSYSFHQTILKRAANEFNHGNMAPLAALAMFIPTMIGADLMKGLIQGGGSLPPYLASKDFGDWIVHGTQRAGLSGIGTIGIDAAHDWASLGGPAFEQIVDGVRDGFGEKTALKAAPLNSLWGRLAA